MACVIKADGDQHEYRFIPIIKQWVNNRELHLLLAMRAFYSKADGRGFVFEAAHGRGKCTSVVRGIDRGSTRAKRRVLGDSITGACISPVAYVRPRTVGTQKRGKTTMQQVSNLSFHIPKTAKDLGLSAGVTVLPHSSHRLGQTAGGRSRPTKGHSTRVALMQSSSEEESAIPEPPSPISSDLGFIRSPVDGDVFFPALSLCAVEPANVAELHIDAASEVFYKAKWIDGTGNRDVPFRLYMSHTVANFITRVLHMSITYCSGVGGRCLWRAFAILVPVHEGQVMTWQTWLRVITEHESRRYFRGTFESRNELNRWARHRGHQDHKKYIAALRSGAAWGGSDQMQTFCTLSNCAILCFSGHLSDLEPNRYTPPGDIVHWLYLWNTVTSSDGVHIPRGLHFDVLWLGRDIGGVHDGIIRVVHRFLVARRTSCAAVMDLCSEGDSPTHSDGGKLWRGYSDEDPECSQPSSSNVALGSLKLPCSMPFGMFKAGLSSSICSGSFSGLQHSISGITFEIFR